MKLKVKLAVSLGTLCLLILGMGVFAVFSLSRLDTQNSIYTSFFQADLQLSKIKASLSQADSRGANKQALSLELSRHVSKTQEVLLAAQQMMVVDESIREISKVRSAVETFAKAFDALESVTADTSFNNGNQAAVRRMVESVEAASLTLAKLMKAETDIADQARSDVRAAIYFVIMVSLVLASGLAWWLSVGILRPLAKSVSIAEAISRGDLTYHVDTVGEDEFSELNRKLLKSMGVLRQTMQKIQQSLATVKSVSIEVDGAVEKSSQSMTEQQVESDMLATALEEMAASTREIAGSAEHACDASQQAEKQAANGNAIINTAKDAMISLSGAMESAREVVTKLDHDSKSIAGIVETILSIAEQTNLLALNAAIESARAGEAGRGFAVVADEVRHLAQRTQSSTVEITEIVQLIQQGAENVVNVINRSYEESNHVVTLNNDASKVYHSISELIRSLSEMNTQVSIGANEQSSVSTEVSKSVGKIIHLSDTNNEHLGMIKEQAKKQADETLVLKKFVDTFQV